MPKNENEEFEFENEDGEGEEKTPPKKDVPQNPAMAAKIAARRQAASNRRKNYGLAILGLACLVLLGWTFYKGFSGDSSKPAVVSGNAAPAVGDLGAPAPLVPTTSGANSGSSAQPPADTSSVANTATEVVDVWCKRGQQCVQTCEWWKKQQGYENYFCKVHHDLRPSGGGIYYRQQRQKQEEQQNRQNQEAPISQNTAPKGSVGGAINFDAILSGSSTSSDNF